jgi:peptidoglycan-N-acetylglucosamine deacetylase
VLAAALLLCAGADAKPPSGDGPAVLQQLVWRGLPVYCGGGKARLVALTFDDGPGPWTLPLVSALRHAGAPATFFLVGSRVVYWPEGARAAAVAGSIGNHTWTHPHLAGMKPARIARQLRWTQLQILETTRRLPAVFRPPYEEADRRIDQIASSLGLLDVRWSVDSGDASRSATPAAVIRRVLAEARPGSIVLLHDAHVWAPAAARAIVRGLRLRRLRPVTVPTLLEVDPPRGRCG